MPAWFWMPLKTTRYWKMPTIAVTTPDALVVGLERSALLDMGLEIGAIAAVLEREARLAGETGTGDGLAQRGAVLAVPGGVDFLLGQAADEGPAAGHAGEMAFLVGPRRDIDAEPGAGRVLGESPRDFEAVDHAP